jgi:hypothetical protein
MIGKQNNNPAAVNNHFKLLINMPLRNAARDEDKKLEAFLKAKERKKREEAIHIECAKRFITERWKCPELYCI